MMAVSSGAQAAFKLSGTRLLEKHAIAPSAARLYASARRWEFTLSNKEH
jgi:hypothetical protein